MDMSNLEYFLEVARCGSITKASKKLFISPQALSKQIQKLEGELETTLFVRETGGIALTESGEYLKEHLPNFIHDFQRMRNDIQCIKTRETHEIELLSAYGILRLVTPECLIAFHEKYPDIHVNYKEYPDHIVERLFLGGDGNAAFTIGNDVLKHVDYEPMERFEIKLLVHKDNPLAKKEFATLADLASAPLYIESPEFHIHDMILDACAREGIEPTIAFEASGFSLCHKMVEKNKGIAVTVDFIFDDMHKGNTVMIPFEGRPFYWETFMLTRRSIKPVPEIKLFHDFVLTWMEGIKNGTISR